MHSSFSGYSSVNLETTTATELDKIEQVGLLFFAENPLSQIKNPLSALRNGVPLPSHSPYWMNKDWLMK